MGLSSEELDAQHFELGSHEAGSFLLGELAQGVAPPGLLRAETCSEGARVKKEKSAPRPASGSTPVSVGTNETL